MTDRVNEMITLSGSKEGINQNRLKRISRVEPMRRDEVRKKRRLLMLRGGKRCSMKSSYNRAEAVRKGVRWGGGRRSQDKDRNTNQVKRNNKTEK